MKKYWVLIAVFAELVVAACTADAAICPGGDFVRAVRNRIYLLNFRTSKNELIYEFPAGTFVEDKMYQIDSRTLLFALADRYQILTLDLYSMDIKRLGTGMSPTYLPTANAIIYYGRDKDGKGALLVSDENLGNPRVIAPSTRYDPTMILRISSEDVVFQTGDSSDKSLELWKYNVTSDSLVKLGLPTDCMLLNVWRETTRELLCQKITTNRFDTYFFLMALDSGEEETVEFDGNLNAGQYLPDIDALVVQKPRWDLKGGEHWDLWLYQFDDASTDKVMSDAGFSPNAFVQLTEPVHEY